jgi:ATP-dependent Clp protease ATP-binding subunit ClpA
MFERYSEAARLAIFYSRSEAGQRGASQIRPVHILLGIFRADPETAGNLFSSPAATLLSIGKELALTGVAGARIPDSADLPLSPDAKEVLSFAAGESDKLGHQQIGTAHLLLGMIKESQSFAGQILSQQGITFDKVLAYLNQKKDWLEDPLAGNEKRTLEGKPGGSIGSVAGGVAEEHLTRKLNARFAGQNEGLQAREKFNKLVDLLVQKGLITEKEKQDLLSE